MTDITKLEKQIAEKEAHEAWRVAKNEQAHILAKNISENAIKDALINRY